MRPSVDDYRTLLVRAFAVVTTDSSEARQEIYDRTRAALKAELNKLVPPPSDAEFFEERQKLNAAIFDFEFSNAT
jgi:hypothetical protein